MQKKGKICDLETPRNLDGVICQDRIVRTLKRWLELRDFPDSIHLGPSGVGKSTTIKAFLSEYFGGFDVWEFTNGQHPDLLVLNASDERGINTIRDRVKEFSNALPSTDVPYRIIWFEEGDKVTPDAQDALRNIVEDAAPTCRFMYSGNREKFTSAMFSRASVFMYPALPVEPCAKKLVDAGKRYGIDMSMEIAMLIAKKCKGDLRKMYNNHLEKLRGIGTVTEKDLDFDSSVSEHAKKIYVALMAGNDPMDKYYKARSEYMKLDAKYRMPPIQLLGELERILGPLSFKVAEAFSTAVSRIVQSKDEKQIHVGYVLAVIAKCIPT